MLKTRKTDKIRSGGIGDVENTKNRVDTGDIGQTIDHIDIISGALISGSDYVRRRRIGNIDNIKLSDRAIGIIAPERKLSAEAGRFV
jgi:hypothetical protein